MPEPMRRSIHGPRPSPGRRLRPAMRRFWMLLRRAPLSAKIGLAIVALNLLAALLAPLIAPHGETVVVGAVWAGGFWSADFAGRKDLLLLGTDQLGRDLLSRMLYGARNTIAIAIATTTLS